MTVLIDGKEAFGSAADDIEAAKTSLNMTQLFFATPDYEPTPIDEKPKLVFSFGEKIAPLDPLPSGGTRPRYHDRRTGGRNASSWRRLGGRSPCASFSTNRWPTGRRGVLAPGVAGRSGRSWDRGRLAGGHGHGCGVALFPVFLGLAFAFLFLETFFAGRALDSGSDVPSCRHTWRKAWPTFRSLRATSPSEGSNSRHRTTEVLHTKMVIADGQRATVLGSPYSQRYFDDPRHQIDNPERGDTTSDIVHDVSVGLVGPVVGDLHETFRVYWNEDQPSGSQIPSLPPDQVAKAPDFGTGRVVKVQVVRTSARAGSTSSTAGVRRGSSRATCARSVRRNGSSTWRTSTSPTRSSPTPGQGSEGQAGP